MEARNPPEWFILGDEATTQTMKRIAASVHNPSLPLEVQFLPAQAHWFILDTLLLSNRANREGMHANALSLTRQCLEAVSILELGGSAHPEAVDLMLKWEKNKISPGELRRWLSVNAWPSYGTGLWAESWSDYMTQLARAIQPYAHYTAHLMQWQSRLLGPMGNDDDSSLYVQYAPRAYDPQKATRITLFHGIITYTLARIWIATTDKPDFDFNALVERYRVALGRSKYLDGHQSDWEQQFWAMVWNSSGGTILE